MFLTGNHQVRRFRDFHQVESQNWFMGSATRRVGEGTLAAHGMVSLEPFTLRKIGSSQVFQTGETFEGGPLIDFQHPHDFFMGLSLGYERAMNRTLLQVRGGLVDAPALGPTAFMHRASATLQPTAPLSHHQVDSTHITHGVITALLRTGAWQVESSAFHGREPDEDRIGLDLGALDSYSVRGSWIRESTRAQVSVGRLNDPHAGEPGDVTRVTASIEHEGSVGAHAMALTLAWGQNRDRRANEDALLAEATIALNRRGTAYGRAELVEKHIIGAGFHAPGFEHPHVLSTVGALTAGYQHRVWMRPSWAVSLGGDVTGHVTPANLAPFYGRPVSIHVYGRWALRYSERPLQEAR